MSLSGGPSLVRRQGLGGNVLALENWRVSSRSTSHVEKRRSKDGAIDLQGILEGFARKQRLTAWHVPRTQLRCSEFIGVVSSTDSAILPYEQRMRFDHLPGWRGVGGDISSHSLIIGKRKSLITEGGGGSDEQRIDPVKPV
jgi:hypothetical protein